MTSNYQLTDLQKEVLKSIKEKKKDFLKYCRTEWHNPLFLTGTSTVGLQYFIRLKYGRINPNYGQRLIAIQRAIHVKLMDYRLKDSPEHLGFLEYLYERYKALIVSKPILKPLTKETKVLDELLKRGFVRNSDHRFEKGSYVIEATQFGMVYPRNFIARKTVRVYLKKFSLVNYCTIIKI